MTAASLERRRVSTADFAAALGIPAGHRIVSVTAAGESVTVTTVEWPEGAQEVTVQAGTRCRHIAECARCGHIKSLKSRDRGLCRACSDEAAEDGTLSEYGVSPADRITVFAAYRRAGLSVPESAARTGVCTRQGHRYEAALIEAGQAPWRPRTDGEAHR